MAAPRVDAEDMKRGGDLVGQTLATTFRFLEGWVRYVQRAVGGALLVSLRQSRRIVFFP
jgi:hypothetical protein